MSAKSVSLCAVVISRYDLLREMLESALTNGYPLQRICVIDNGQDLKRLESALQVARSFDTAVMSFTPHEVFGLAEAWNWFIETISEERLIVGDDIVFKKPGTIQRMVETPGDFVTAKWFGCFIIRDSCINKVGTFDETISPGYLYFEDIDYAQRMMLSNVPITQLDLGVFHHGSASLKVIPEHEMQTRHHDRFLRAQANYVKKWGSIPSWIPQDI